MQLPKPKIGLVAMTLELYEQLVPGLRQGREQWLRDALLPALAPAADVCFSGAVYRRDDFDAAVAAHESAGVDALLLVFLTYAPSLIALPGLARTRLPIVIWNTQELQAVDDRFDTARMIDNHGVHGTQDLANVLVRGGVPFHYVTSHVADAKGVQEIGDYFYAASAVAALRTCRLGLMGYSFPGMGDVALDATHLAATLGCRWTSLASETYHRRAAAAPAGAVANLKDDYRRSYAVTPDVLDTDLDAAARAEWSLRSMAADARLDSLTFQFLALGEDERTVTLPFVAVSRMMADGFGFAGEGDLVGAAGTWFLNRLSPPASFSEIFTIDFAGGGMLLSHMGEANVAMARKDRPVPLVARLQPITRTRGRQLALVTSFEPGPATLCALTLGPRSRWRLIAGFVEIKDYGPLPSMPVPHSKIGTHGDVRDWLTAYARAGGPHHIAICFGDARPRLKFAARLLDADYCEV